MNTKTPLIQTTKNSSAFTMVELIFVVVIIAIIAAVSLPRLTATKDDAISVSIKNDISNTATAVVSTYNSIDNFNDISKAILLDETRWTKTLNTNGTEHLAYTFTTKENNKECVRMEIDDANVSRSFQVLVASNLKDITGNNSRICAKIRRVYNKHSDGKDNLLGDSINDSIVQYLSIMNIQLDSDGIVW